MGQDLESKIIPKKKKKIFVPLFVSHQEGEMWDFFSLGMR